MVSAPVSLRTYEKNCNYRRKIYAKLFSFKETRKYADSEKGTNTETHYHLTRKPNETFTVLPKNNNLHFFLGGERGGLNATKHTILTVILDTMHQTKITTLSKHELIVNTSWPGWGNKLISSTLPRVYIYLSLPSLIQLSLSLDQILRLIHHPSVDLLHFLLLFYDI